MGAGVIIKHCHYENEELAVNVGQAMPMQGMLSTVRGRGKMVTVKITQLCLLHSSAGTLFQDFSSYIKNRTKNLLPQAGKVTISTKSITLCLVTNESKQKEVASGHLNKTSKQSVNLFLNMPMRNFDTLHVHKHPTHK